MKIGLFFFLKNLFSKEAMALRFLLEKVILALTEDFFPLIICKAFFLSREPLAKPLFILFKKISVETITENQLTSEQTF